MEFLQLYRMLCVLSSGVFHHAYSVAACVCRLARRDSLSFPKAAAVIQADTFAIGIAAVIVYWIYMYLTAMACSNHHWAWPVSTPARLHARRPPAKHITGLLHQKHPVCESKSTAAAL